MKPSAKYDSIGGGYSKCRRADSRLVDELVGLLALEPGEVIADVGAGCGNYSRALADRGFRVRAIEPSEVMRRQAEQHADVEWFDGVAEAIPLASNSVSAAVVFLALHHFHSTRQAASELMRISSGPILIFTCDPRLAEPFWLADYFPTIFENSNSLFPPVEEIGELFESTDMTSTVREFLLPHDLEDLFLPAGWRRPEIYLDPNVRAGMSPFVLANAATVERGVERLQADLASGAWRERHGALFDRQHFDAGYRFICLRPDECRLP